MSVDKETVIKIAKLSRIAISDNEADAMVSELNGILGWVEQLGEVNVTGVEPMTAVIANKTRMRDDVVNADAQTGGGIPEKILANAPAKEGTFFGVPKVIE
jgi:aspartyl-tRNA(Asn)/glutamyl-tRNA(Gln) amidotransferase subunit C